MLEVVRASLGIPEDEHRNTTHEVQIESYTEALRAAWGSGALSVDDVTTKEHLRKLFAISEDEHRLVEATLRTEMKHDGRR